MKRNPRRLFTEAFKREAIKRVSEQPLNIAAAGQQLEVDPKSIRARMAQADRGELKATLGAVKLAADQPLNIAMSGCLDHSNGITRISTDGRSAFDRLYQDGTCAKAWHLWCTEDSSSACGTGHFGWTQLH